MKTTCCLIIALITSSLFAQAPAQRPHLLGIAHVAFRVSDMSRTRAFYTDFLGYAEPFTIKNSDGTHRTEFVKINDQQYVELFLGDARSQGQFDHFAIYTDDLARMSAYLLSQGVHLVEDIHKGRIGNSFLSVRDPDGHLIEILQYSSTSMTAQSRGKFLPAVRVSSHITHVGILISSVGPAMRFYRDVLGFHEFARGGGSSTQPGWVDLQAPDGSDYIELLPFAGLPSPADLRAQNHFSLATSDVHKTVTALQSRATDLPSPITVLTGSSLPPRANLFDPDGARVEIMEAGSRGSAIATSYP